MTNVDVKTVGELFKFVGPAEEHRDKFTQTLPGSLLDKAVVSVCWVAFCRLPLTLLFLDCR
jgi:hypothetical protein